MTDEQRKFNLERNNKVCDDTMDIFTNFLRGSEHHSPVICLAMIQGRTQFCANSGTVEDLIKLLINAAYDNTEMALAIMTASGIIMEDLNNG